MKNARSIESAQKLTAFQAKYTFNEHLTEIILAQKAS